MVKEASLRSDILAEDKRTLACQDLEKGSIPVRRNTKYWVLQLKGIGIFEEERAVSQRAVSGTRC